MINNAISNGGGTNLFSFRSVQQITAVNEKTYTGKGIFIPINSNGGVYVDGISLDSVESGFIIFKSSLKIWGRSGEPISGILYLF